MVLLQMVATDLVALSQDLCDCLQRTPQSFSSSELKVTETKEAFDVTYPDAAFMVVSCVDDRSVSSRPPRSVYVLVHVYLKPVLCTLYISSIYSVLHCMESISDRVYWSVHTHKSCYFV